MDDLISRKDAINAIYERIRQTGYENDPLVLSIRQAIRDLSPAQPERKKVEMEAVSLYGYDVRHLAFIAAVMAEKNITPLDVFEMFSNISAARDYLYEEQRRILREEVEHFLGGTTP